MKALSIFVVLIASSMLTFSQSESQMMKRFDSTSIPKDILDKDLVLLVMVPYNTEKWFEKFAKVMDEHYTGKYEIIAMEKIDAKYGDTKKYKYVLTFAGSSTTLSKYSIQHPADFHGKKIPDHYGERNALAIHDRQNPENLYYSGLYGWEDSQKLLAFYLDKISGK